MKIIIKEENRARIDEAIKMGQGRATARCISADDFFYACGRIEKHLGIPASKLKGIRAIVDLNAQTFPSAYKYTPMSTYISYDDHFMVEFKTGLETDITM